MGKLNKFILTNMKSLIKKKKKNNFAKMKK